MKTSDIAYYIAQQDGAYEGYQIECQPIPGEVDVLQVTVDSREEVPIFVSIAEDQILCIAWLFEEDEVDQSRKAEMNESMLAMNMPMPLSSFAKIDQRYVVFGALSVKSSMEDICHELVILSNNTIDALEVMTEFLA